MYIYNAGKDKLAEWETGSYEVILLTGGAVDIDDDTVAAVIGSDECTATGYARVVPQTPVRVIDDVNDRINYTCDDLDFGSITSSETITAVVLTYVVTNDADSIPIGWQDVDAVDTLSSDPFIVHVFDQIMAHVEA